MPEEQIDPNELAFRKGLALDVLSWRAYEPETDVTPLIAAAVVAEKPTYNFPGNTAPKAFAIAPAPAPDAAFPKADVIVVTWTRDEWEALADVLTPGVSVAKLACFLRCARSGVFPACCAPTALPCSWSSARAAPAEGVRRLSGASAKAQGTRRDGRRGPASAWGACGSNYSWHGGGAHLLKAGATRGGNLGWLRQPGRNPRWRDASGS